MSFWLEGIIGGIKHKETKLSSVWPDLREELMSHYRKYTYQYFFGKTDAERQNILTHGDEQNRSNMSEMYEQFILIKKTSDFTLTYQLQRQGLANDDDDDL